MGIELKMMTSKQFEKQVRFAVMKALNDSAFHVRKALVGSLGESFSIRSPYSEKGLHVVKATKSRLVAQVGQKRAYLLDHVVGGKRDRASIPFKRLRQNKRIRRAQWPGRQIESGKAFVTRSRRGGGRVVMRRVGRRRLRPQWSLPDVAQTIKPRWRYGDVALRAMRPGFIGLFSRHLTNALKSAR